jgi:DNA processing protein
MFGIGTRRSHVLLEYFSSPGDILEGIKRKNQVLTMLREEELISSDRVMGQALEILRRTGRKGCAVVTPDHPDYPPLLKNIFARPAALYVKGDLSCLKDSLVIAMVGTRSYTDYGRDAAKALASALAENGVAVVSGLAKGIDSICHEAALGAGGKSVGILGCGIDVDYPKGSAPLKRALCQNGAVLSEYPLGFEPMKGNFPMRNRIISGMSHGTVVVEADMKSGSIITATHASEQGREVFAVPGSIFSIREQGTHRLIKEGAKLTESAADILEEFSGSHFAELIPAKGRRAGEDSFLAVKQLALETAAPTDKPRENSPGDKRLPEEISAAAREVRGLMGQEPASFDSIAARCDLAAGDIQTALTELEIYGLIRGYPGRRFSL